MSHTAAVFRVRAAKPNDLKHVLSLDQQTDTVPHWSLANYAAAISQVDQGAETLSVRRCFFVAEDASGIVGFAVGQIMAGQAELESVGVAESARRRGIGRALCSEVIAWSQQMEASEIELEVRSRSGGAISLYREIGFEAVGVRARYYRGPEDDAVLMRLDLASKAVRVRVEGSNL